MIMHNKFDLDPRFKEAEEKYGKEVALALYDHVSTIGKEFYLWLTTLFVPRKCVCENFDKDGNRICLLPKDKCGNYKCHGGGFYYSNSARDNEEFEIDIESTVQALHFLMTSGMTRNYKNGIADALPRQMQLDVCAFAKSLQSDVDGYFYHPQWGENITPSRKGRDLRWATMILNNFGDMPLYDTKNGAKGSLGAPKGAHNDDPEETKEKTTWIPELRTIESFTEYLDAMDLRANSYSSFNNINAIAEQIASRDNKALEDGENLQVGFRKTLEENFNSRQNEENGLWEEKVSYRSSNGLMKLVTSYNVLGIKLQNAIKAFRSAMEVALLPPDECDVHGAKASASVDVFNPWVSMRAIRYNAECFGDKEDLDVIDSLLSENLVALIRNTTEKTKKFKKPDGSFGYTWDYSPYKSQGAPVAIPQTIEGDVNGGTIAVGGILGHMCVALGLEKIPIYSQEDLDEYIKIIKRNGGYR